MTALEAGYARMGDVLKKPRLRRRYLVVVAGGAHAARSLTERIRGVESLAAISDAEVRETGRAERVTRVVSSGSRRVAAVQRARRRRARRVVTHELTHAALAGVDLRPHAVVADRGDRALRVRGPPRRRRGRYLPARPAAAPAAR